MLMPAAFCEALAKALLQTRLRLPEAEEARMAQAAESLRDMGVAVPEGDEKLDSFC